MIVTGFDPARRRPPSVATGVALTWRLRRLVVVLWIVHQLLVLPMWAVAASVLRGVPGDGIDLATADSEALVVILEVVRPVAWPMAFAALSGLLGWWAWTVLWRAGVVTWAVWGTPGTSRVTEILGHGLVRWWRFVRLHLAAAIVLGAAMFAVSAVVADRVGRAASMVAEGRVLSWMIGGVVAVAIVMNVVAAATAAGCWRLGTPGVHSALRGLWQGLEVVGRHPLRAVAITAGWWVVLGGLAAAPLWIAVSGASPRTSFALLEGCLLLRAGCRVALLGSFEPVLGVEPHAE